MYVMYQRAKSERKTKRKICLLIIYVVAVFYVCLWYISCYGIWCICYYIQKHEIVGVKSLKYNRKNENKYKRVMDKGKILCCKGRLVWLKVFIIMIEMMWRTGFLRICFHSNQGCNQMIFFPKKTTILLKDCWK